MPHPSRLAARDGGEAPHNPPAAALGPDLAALLVTKLLIPTIRPEALARPRLFAHLDAARSAPLTLVVAPAGFGKTTLLAGWLADLRRRNRRNHTQQTTTASFLSVRVINDRGGAPWPRSTSVGWA